MFNAIVTSVFVLSAYTLFQVISEGGKTASRRYIIAVILILALSQVPPFILDKLAPGQGLFIESLPTRHWVFLIGPAVYFYARACMGLKNKKSDLLHLVPALFWWVFFLFTLSRFIQLPHIPKIYGFTCVVSLLSYGFLLQLALAKYVKKLRNHYSYRNIFLEIRWLSFIAVVLVAVTLGVSLSVNLFNKISPPEGPPIHKYIGDPEFINILHASAVLVFLFVFTLMAQKQEILRSPLEMEQFVPKKKPEKKPEDPCSEFKELMLFMKSSKIYLESTLSLQKLSDESGISRHELSRLINDNTGGNFFHFINGFRAREFNEVIKNNRYPHYNLLSIAHECGFNSKAPFNAAIKREFSKTPSHLAREIRSSL